VSGANVKVSLNLRVTACCNYSADNAVHYVFVDADCDSSNSMLTA